jgi:hypothetical protein
MIGPLQSDFEPCMDADLMELCLFPSVILQRAGGTALCAVLLAEQHDQHSRQQHRNGGGVKQVCDTELLGQQRAANAAQPADTQNPAHAGQVRPIILIYRPLARLRRPPKNPTRNLG